MARRGRRRLHTPHRRRADQYADRLLADLSTLKGEVADADYTGEQIAKGAKELLDEVANGKVTGEEEFWSHTDLYDFQANVDGAKTSFDVLDPGGGRDRPRAAQTLTTRFTELQTLLDQHRDSDGFESYRPDATTRCKAALRRRQRAVRAAGATWPRRSPRGDPPADRLPARPARRGGRDRRRPRRGSRRVALVARDDDPVPLVRLPRGTPGRDRHPRPGPAALRRLRRHHRATAPSSAALLSADRAAEALTAGRPVGDAEETPYNAPPRDTGEAGGLSAARLTLTFGFGPGLFRDGDGRDRFGLADRRPRALERLPHFPADQLDPARSDGDLCVQACADDPQVAVHAIRNLARLAFGTAAIRSSQLGFGRTSSTSRAQATPRNLFGFKDGTANLKSEDAGEVSRHVLGGARRRSRGRLAGRRQLPGRATDQHEHRDLGPDLALRAGGADRP